MKKILTSLILALIFTVIGLNFSTTVKANSFNSNIVYKNSNGTISAIKYQKGYYKPSKNKWVNGHFKTSPDKYTWNNRKNLYGW